MTLEPMLPGPLTPLAIALVGLAFAVNVIVAGSVGAACLRGAAGMDAAYGEDSAARRILASVYLAIAGLSAAGLVGLMIWPDIAAMIAWPLLSLQLLYKLLTVFTVGPSNPVVRANLAVCLVLAAALVSLAL